MTEAILITGGTGKFGRCFVEHFSNKGWQVFFTTTNMQRGQEFIREAQLGKNVIALVSDLTQGGAVIKLSEEIEATGVGINHLVNNARSLSSLGTNDVGETERSEFLAEYLMDVVVPYELSMALVRKQCDYLKTITNIGSQYGSVAANPHLYDDYSRQSPIQYGVAKAALSHLTKELAVRFANKSIRVNCIAYGGVEGRVDSKFLERYSKLAPSGRMLMENELVGPLELLISDSCNAVTGHTLQADGGWTLW